MILTFSDCCRHDNNHEVPVSCIFIVRNLLMKSNAQVIPEHGLDGRPPLGLLLIQFANLSGKFIKKSKCSLRRGCFASVFEDPKSFME